MIESSTPPARPRAHRRVALALSVLIGAYLLQAASPLRLNNDAEAFLSLARSAGAGHGFTIDGCKTHFPLGYPAAVAALDRVGLGTSSALIALNLAALGIGLRLWCRRVPTTFGPDAPTASALAAIALLAWPMIKHVTLPVSDVLYTGISLVALTVLHAAARAESVRNRTIALVAAVVIIAAAISVRTIGIALIAALAVAAWPATAWPALLGWARRQWWAALLLAVVVAAIAGLAARAVMGTLYFAEMLEKLQGTSVATQAADRLQDWGELVLNVSSAQLPSSFHPVILSAGICFPLVLVAGLWRRRCCAPVDAYVIAYVAIMLVWPHRDARFWVPLLPILPAYAMLALRPGWRHPAARVLTVVYIAGFALAGVAALVQTTRVTFSGAAFPDRYAGGALHATYRAAFRQALSPEEAAQANPRQLELLRHFEPRAQGTP